MLKQLPTPTQSDLKRLENYDSGVRVRAMIEMALARRVITDLLQAGHTIRVDDGEERHPWVRPNDDGIVNDADVDSLMDQCFAVDDCYLQTRGHNIKGWVRFVMGNTGWDLICDYTTNLEEVLTGANAYAEELCDWC